MPNHIKNRIKINSTPQIVEKIFNQYNTHINATLYKTYDNKAICQNKGGKIGWFDFKTGLFHQRNEDPVQGLPEEFEVEISQPSDCFPDFKKILPPPDTSEYRDEPSQQAVREHPNNWYNWNLNNWGTKWNSYDHEKESFNIYVFETAWSGVPNLIQIISAQFPDVEIDYEYSDEDTGYNCGSFKFLNGEVVEEVVPKGGSKEAYDLAFKLRPDHQDWYELVDGEWVYKED